jgi:hypothetical protein
MTVARHGMTVALFALDPGDGRARPWDDGRAFGPPHGMTVARPWDDGRGDGKVEVHPAHRRTMANVILAHPKREQTIKMSAAELERHQAQAHHRDDAPKQAPRRGRGR